MKEIPKHERKAIEKIWNVLQEIEEHRLMSAPKEPIRLPFMPPNFAGTKLAFDQVAGQRQAIVRKLAASKAIKDVKSTDGLSGFWYFHLDLNYKKIFNSYQKKYKDAARQVDEAKNVKVKETPLPSGGKHIDLDISDEIKITDELSIVKKARENALKDQQETFEYMANTLAPQLNFETPILALDAFRESIERMQKFNEGLFAFRNIFSAHTKAMQDIIEASRQTTEAFNTAVAFTKKFDEILKTTSPFLLTAPSTAQPIKVKPTASIEQELRQEMAELRNELVKYRELIEQPNQPLLAAKSSDPPVSYDKATKTIYVKGIPVGISTNTRSGSQVDICDLVFKSKASIKDGVSNKVIFEMWGNYNVDTQYVRKHWRQIYQVVKRINEKVSNKTYAPQFIICDTYRTKINKFYL